MNKLNSTCWANHTFFCSPSSGKTRKRGGGVGWTWPNLVNNIFLFFMGFWETKTSGSLVPWFRSPFFVKGVLPRLCSSGSKHTIREMLSVVYYMFYHVENIGFPK